MAAPATSKPPTLPEERLLSRLRDSSIGIGVWNSGGLLAFRYVWKVVLCPMGTASAWRSSKEWGETACRAGGR